MDEKIIRRVAIELEEACARSSAVYEIDSNLGYSGRSLDEVDVNYRSFIVGLAAAFQYDFRHGPSDRDNPPFIPMFTLADGTEIPPAPPNAPTAMVDSWSDAASQVVHPAAISRLTDLLFCSRRSPVGEFADRAIQGYLALSRLHDWQSLDKSDGLLRALEIATLTRKRDLREVILPRMQELASERLEAEDAPGVVLPLLEELSRNSETVQQARRDLETALDVYHEVHTRDGVFASLRQIATDDKERLRLSLARVGAWVDAARDADNAMTRMSFLEDARRLADDYGLIARAAEITTELQRIDKDELGLSRIQSTFEITREEYESYISQFTDAENLQRAVDALSIHPPLTGIIEETRAAVQRMSKEAPLRSIIPSVKLGSDGLPRWTASTPAQEEDEKLADHETIRIQMAAPLFADGLEAMGEYYNLDEEALRAHLRDRSGVSEQIADGLTQALVLYWRGQYHLSSLVGLWLIETAARNLLLQADQAIYISQREQRPGQYPGLRVLLRELQRVGLDASWFRFFWTIFASPAGMNLRNEVAHGFAGELNKIHAAMIIHGLNYLASLSATPDKQESADGGS